MKTKNQNVSFTIKPFKNRNGAISHRVSGWLLGERVRRNFKSREDAIVERGALMLKQAQADSSLRVVSTFLTDSQLREAEASFLKLKAAPRSMSFYINYGLENYREPKACVTVANAIPLYEAARAKDAAQGLISQGQVNNIHFELLVFKKYFSQNTLAELTTEKLLDYIQRDGGKLKTQNNRRCVLMTFFKFACSKGWLAADPMAGITRHRTDHKRGSAPALNAAQAAELMAHVETLYDGALVPFFALCLFAGIRPNGEISKLLAADIRLENNAISIEPYVSKVGMRRLADIQPNLAAWLRAYPLKDYPIIPPKMKNMAGKLTRIRKKFSLAPDVLRHTFISMHVAKFRSMGDTALQAGNSESIIRRHYLNVTTPQEAEEFFKILPKLRAAPAAPVALVAPVAPVTPKAPEANAAAAAAPAANSNAPFESRQLAA